jgi:hypothetical protein
MQRMPIMFKGMEGCLLNGPNQEEYPKSKV